MSLSPEPLSVRFDDYSFWVELEDGRTLGVPLAWFPRILHGTPAQREAVELSRGGLHREELDEDISIARLLARAGRHDSAEQGRGVNETLVRRSFSEARDMFTQAGVAAE